MTTLELLLFLKNLQPGFRYYSSSLFLITHIRILLCLCPDITLLSSLLQKNTRHYYPAVKFQKVATWYLKIRPNQTKMISRESNIIYAIPSFPVSSEPCTSLAATCCCWLLVAHACQHGTHSFQVISSYKQRGCIY